MTKARKPSPGPEELDADSPEGQAALAEAFGAGPKRSKFNTVIVWRDGIAFHSAAEADRWSELQLLEQAGEIRGLRRQVRHNLYVNEVRITSYTSDFEYEEGPGWAHIVEDFKSPATASLEAFKLKKKLLLALENIDIRVVMRTRTRSKRG
jgi:hypothetical protein